MLRIAFAAALALLAPIASAADTPPITTPEALARYLRDTPIERSPLGALSPGARKRFLASLRFGDRGLGGFATDDLDQTLTHAQTEAVLALFGAQAYGDGLGLPPASYARRQAERRADAARRGCAVARCPESAIEQRYDTLVLADRPGPDAASHAAIAADYTRLFAGDLAPAALERASAPDLRLLARAARVALEADPDGRAADDLARVLEVMQSRGMVGDADFLPLYRARVTTRHFDAAQRLAQAHPGMAVSVLPALENPPAAPTEPTALTVSADGRHMTRESIDLDAPLRIVVVAACHFSEDAVRAIAADPRLDALFHQHAVWLAADATPPDDAAAWNHAFPGQPIHIAWRDREWSMLESWAMPTYYVFRHGREVARWSGWLGLDALRAELTKAGVPY
ncbi:TlpA family protein disulfide reductase [Dyella sp. KRB-257]|uniref:TlpA family protein disulfide reductase n=1 Tax=Dyella sp. KRB-257 TaxID=3400915 RepID=UPI003C047B3D